MKIGLFFGSFNPVHIGHLVIAQSAVNETDLDKIWLVVSPRNPFKESNSLLDEQERLRMAQLALEGNPDVEASDIEFGLPRPSYTIDTLRHLRASRPQDDFSLMMGEDNLVAFHKWKEYEAILADYPIWCYPRLGSGEGNFEKYPSIRKFEMPYLDISATRIRGMVKEGKSVRYLVPAGAYEYLVKHRFYAD